MAIAGGRFGRLERTASPLHCLLQKPQKPKRPQIKQCIGVARGQAAPAGGK